MLWPGAALLAVLLGGLLASLLIAKFVLPKNVPFVNRIKDTADGWRRGYRINFDVAIITRDQVKLAADLYLPREAGETKVAAHANLLPTILIRVPYGKGIYGESRRAARFFAARGYAVMIQDMRGRYASQGTFTPYSHAVEDGFDTVQWIVAQPWSNGRVGSFGCSALGEIQLITAKAPHPALKAMIARGAGGAMGSAMGRYSYFGVYEGGVFNLATAAGWFATNRGAKSSDAGNDSTALPPRRSLDYLPSIGILGANPSDWANLEGSPKLGDYERFLATPLTSAQWNALGYLRDGDTIKPPTLVFNTWYDPTIADTFAIAELAKQTQAAIHPVVIGPGTHCTGDAPEEDNRVGDLIVTNPRAADTNYPYWEQYLAWFDRWLRTDQAKLASKPKPAQSPPAYQFFVLQENRWLSAEEWPPAGSAEQRWQLSSERGANSRAGDGRLSAIPIKSGTNRAPVSQALENQVSLSREFDELRYDPNNPTPSRGGPICCVDDPKLRAGAVDQTDVETRADVLVYTSEPLAHTLRIVGPLRAHLVVSSSAKDTDFVARLVDVAPDGSTLNIQEGALRLRYRDGIDKPQLAMPGQTYEIDVTIRPTAYLIRQGHRLRLQIASSSFPRLERNLNTGGSNFDETMPVVAINRVWHKPAGRSYVSLFVLPDSAVTSWSP